MNEETLSYEQYKSERLTVEIHYYDSKSIKIKKNYYHLKTVQIILSASIPILTSLVPKFQFILTIISLFGGLLTFTESIISLKKYHEKWIQYRSTAESLKQEMYMFETLSGIYDSKNIDAFKTLVERCESLISSENINWANIDNNNKGKGK